MSHKATKGEKEALEKYLLQFLNFEKRYPLLPGISNRDAMAGLIGLDPDELSKLRSLYTENAREAALELLKEDSVEDWVDELPFQPEDTIIALGDSMTDDLQGWFSIFSNLLDISRPDADYNFVNCGISSDTTSEALRRLHRDVLSKEPDWVIIALGTFDALRLDIAPGRTLLPLSETWENLDTIMNAVQTVTDNPVIWITPPPVIPGLIDEMELFDFDLREQDLFAIREVIAGKTGYIVDPAGRRMGHPPEAWYYLSDGINPSLSGHTNTVKALLKSLAESEAKHGAEIESGLPE
ncbi:MAG: GDSL-type esterase/lipase family protein [Balneolaceae bacterium]